MNLLNRINLLQSTKKCKIHDENTLEHIVEKKNIDNIIPTKNINKCNKSKKSKKRRNVYKCIICSSKKQLHHTQCDHTICNECQSIVRQYFTKSEGECVFCHNITNQFLTNLSL